MPFRRFVATGPTTSVLPPQQAQGDLTAPVISAPNQRQDSTQKFEENINDAFLNTKKQNARIEEIDKSFSSYYERNGFQYLQYGTIIDCYSYLRVYRVLSSNNTVQLCKFLTHSASSPIGTYDASTLSPGTKVWYLLYPGYLYGLIIGSDPPFLSMYNKYSDFIYGYYLKDKYFDVTMGFYKSKVEQLPLNVVNTTIANFAGKTPLDSVESGEFSYATEYGGLLFLDSFMGAFRHDEFCGLWLYQPNDMVRLAHRILEVTNPGGAMLSMHLDLKDEKDKRFWEKIKDKKDMVRFTNTGYGGYSIYPDPDILWYIRKRLIALDEAEKLGLSVEIEQDFKNTDENDKEVIKEEDKKKTEKSLMDRDYEILDYLQKHEDSGVNFYSYFLNKIHKIKFKTYQSVDKVEAKQEPQEQLPEQGESPGGSPGETPPEQPPEQSPGETPEEKNIPKGRYSNRLTITPSYFNLLKQYQISNLGKEDKKWEDKTDEKKDEERKRRKRIGIRIEGIDPERPLPQNAPDTSFWVPVMYLWTQSKKYYHLKVRYPDIIPRFNEPVVASTPNTFKAHGLAGDRARITKIESKHIKTDTIYVKEIRYY